MPGASAPILDITPVALGGPGHVPITGATLFAKFLQIIDKATTSVLGRYLAAQNITTFSAILSLADDYIVNNPAANPADTPHFTDGHLLVQFRAFNCAQMNCNGNHRLHWRNVTPDMFTIFTENFYSPTTTYVSPASVFSSIVTTNAAVGATTLTRTAGMTATSMFQRNIKMNKDDYPKLTKETGWHKFSTDVTTVASVHGIQNVLNPAYAPVPTDADEVALFHLQKRFFYNVLRSNVETDVGKQIVSDHHDVLDGQQAWEALRVRYQDSHAAKLIAHEKLLKIQQTYYTSSWNGTTEGFVTGNLRGFVLGSQCTTKIVRECALAGQRISIK
jgi:hypothetical protein